MLLKGGIIMESGLTVALIIILILEMLRYFRLFKRNIKDIDELKERVTHLENIIKEQSIH